MVSLRQNLFLKIVSLVIAILIYVFVQSERNPTITRPMIATVIYEKIAPGLELVNAKQQVDVTVTGPKQLVDSLKDTDIRAMADMSKFQNDAVKNPLVRLRFEIVNLPAERKREISIDSLMPTVPVEVYPQEKRFMEVVAKYPQNPPAGYHYGRADVRPSRVQVIGRADRLNTVKRLIAIASPPEAGASIDDDFKVSARDADDNPVPNVRIEPDTVHIAVPLLSEPSEKIVTVSPSIPDQPQPPYRLVNVTVMPNKIKIVGKLERIAPIFTLQTEDIPARALTENQEFEASLTIPNDIKVRDLDGHEITHVTVRLSISKASSSGAPTPGTSPKETP